VEKFGRTQTPAPEGTTPQETLSRTLKKELNSGPHRLVTEAQT